MSKELSVQIPLIAGSFKVSVNGNTTVIEIIEEIAKELCQKTAYTREEIVQTFGIFYFDNKEHNSNANVPPLEEATKITTLEVSFFPHHFKEYKIMKEREY